MNFKTPLTVGNVNLQLQPTNAVHYTRFGDFCKRYGDDAYIFGYAPETVDIAAYSTDYSDSVTECLTKPGLHVWMVFADGTFGAARTFSAYEILSKHQDIYLRHGSKPVIAAGEVKVANSADYAGVDVTFNLQSGTFMMPISETFSMKYKTAGSYESFYVPWMIDLWKAAGATTVTYIEPSMISDTDMPLTEDQLRMYNTMGVEFRTFPTKKECTKYAAYYTSVGQAKRNATRTLYNRVKNRGEAMSFENWIGATGRSSLFTRPENAPRMFHGGQRQQQYTKRQRQQQYTKRQRQQQYTKRQRLTRQGVRRKSRNNK